MSDSTGEITQREPGDLSFGIAGESQESEPFIPECIDANSFKGKPAATTSGIAGRLRFLKLLGPQHDLVVLNNHRDGRARFGALICPCVLGEVGWLGRVGTDVHESEGVTLAS